MFQTNLVGGVIGITMQRPRNLQVRKRVCFQRRDIEDFKIKNGILWNTMAMKMLCLVTGGVKLILIIPSMSYSSLCTTSF